MSETGGALRRLMAQIGANTDVLVGGTPVEARRLLAEAAAALAGAATVVSVASPLGELSLSTLIAQLSGRLDFDDQDDAVLELGLKRLTGDGRTVLMLLAPAGISRSALRYLQHVSRHSPRLALAVYRAPALAAMLEEPGFAALRSRLEASPTIEFDAPTQPVAVPRPVVTPPAVVARVPPLLAAPALPAARTRRPLLWAASALGLAAALGGIAWFGHSAPATATAGSRVAHADIPLEPAVVPAPALAGLPTPAAARLPRSIATAASAPASLAKSSLSAAAKLPQVALAAPPSPPVALLNPDPAVAAPAQLQARTERPPQIRRSEPVKRESARLARARPYWLAPREQEPVDYQRAEPGDEVASRWVRRDTVRREPPYLGTYGVDPYGMRTFQYDP